MGDVRQNMKTCDWCGKKYEKGLFAYCSKRCEYEAYEKDPEGYDENVRREEKYIREEKENKEMQKGCFLISFVMLIIFALIGGIAKQCESDTTDTTNDTKTEQHISNKDKRKRVDKRKRLKKQTKNSTATMTTQEEFKDSETETSECQENHSCVEWSDSLPRADEY